MITKVNFTRVKQILLTLILLLTVISCKKAEDDNNNSPETLVTISDIDGNIYETVIIGTQVWLTENLKVIHYNNGDPILNVTDYTNWSNLTSGAYCIYGNKVGNIDSTLYNWYAVNDGRKICPKGWHVPSDDEWKTLEGNFDAKYGVGSGEWDKWGLRGYDAGRNMKSANGWLMNGNGKGLYGFNVPPNGNRYMQDGMDFFDHGYSAWYWTSTESNNNTVIMRYLGYSQDKIARMEGIKKSGFSVRCVKDWGFN